MAKIPLFNIYWDKSDIESVSKVIESGMNWADGPIIGDFEEKITSYMGIKYAIAFNNGTSALHAILLAHDIHPEDEIIVPSFTFISTANACLFVGAKPVFAEIEKRYMGLEPEDVKNKITKKTKAIIPVHFGGCPCCIKELKEIAENNNLLLIEDNAESMGATVDGKKVGTFGDSGILSFCQNKIISTGEGGAVITNSKDIANKLKLIRSHGRLATGDYFSSSHSFDYVSLGYNFRIPTMNAALGISQITKIDKIIDLRRENAHIYTEYLKKYSEIKTLSYPMGILPVYQMYSILINASQRDALRTHLSEQGIASKIYFDPVHLSKFYREKYHYKRGDLPHTEDISDSILSLPMYPSLQKEDIIRICNSIGTFLEEST